MNGLWRYERKFKKSTTHGGLHLIADRVLYVLERGLNNLKYYLFRK